MAAAPTFASRWLVPHLPAFLQRHPNVRVTLGLMSGYADFRRGGSDLGITTRDCLGDAPEAGVGGVAPGSVGPGLRAGLLARPRAIA